MRFPMNAAETISQTATVIDDASERIHEARKFANHGERTNARDALAVVKLRLSVATASCNSAIRELTADMKGDETPNLLPFPAPSGEGEGEKKKGGKARVEGDGDDAVDVDEQNGTVEAAELVALTENGMAVTNKRKPSLKKKNAKREGRRRAAK